VDERVIEGFGLRAFFQENDVIELKVLARGPNPLKGL